MSHEDRIKEQQELLSHLSQEKIAFLRSLRIKRENAEKTGENGTASLYQSSTLEHNENVKSIIMESEDSKTRVQDDDLADSSTSLPCRQPSCEESSTSDETRKVKFSDDVDMKEISSDDETIPESELPIPPSEARKWLHMDKVNVKSYSAWGKM